MVKEPVHIPYIQKIEKYLHEEDLHKLYKNFYDVKKMDDNVVNKTWIYNKFKERIRQIEESLYKELVRQPFDEMIQTSNSFHPQQPMEEYIVQILDEVEPNILSFLQQLPYINSYYKNECSFLYDQLNDLFQKLSDKDQTDKLIESQQYIEQNMNTRIFTNLKFFENIQLPILKLFQLWSNVVSSGTTRNNDIDIYSDRILDILGRITPYLNEIQDYSSYTKNRCLAFYRRVDHLFQIHFSLELEIEPLMKYIYTFFSEKYIPERRTRRVYGNQGII
jgi:hypothetical protein